MNIQTFDIQDLPFIGHLQPAGWGDIAPNMLGYCLQDFCKPIKVVDKQHIVGVGALILHVDSAWLAHIIVDESYRGRGIGRQLVEHLVQEALIEGCLSVNLIATDLGAPVYQKVGFKAVGHYQFLNKTADYVPNKISECVRTGGKEYHQQVLEMDRDVTGEDRNALIGSHLHQAVVYEEDAVLEGYYLPTLGQGPIYAITERAGLALMKLKYSQAQVAVLPQSNSVGLNFLLQSGFEKRPDTAIRMVYGRETLWRPTQIFSRIGGNYG